MLIIYILLCDLINGLNLKNEFIEEPKDIETKIGSTIIFRCRTKPFHNNEITWCINDFCTLGKTRNLPSYDRYEIIGDPNKGEHDFKIINASLEDIGIYQCQIRAGFQRSPSVSRKAKLNVLQIPQNFSIDNPVILIENVESFILCRSYGGTPEPKLYWNLPKSLNKISQKDYVFISDNLLRYSISNLTVLANRSSHGQSIECQADSSAIQIFNKTLITKQYIQTYFSPEINLNIIGQQIEGKLIVILCSIQSRPYFTKIQWFNGTSLLNIRDENRLSILLNRYNHQNKITCQVRNQVGITNQSIILQIIYKPIFVDQNGLQIKNSSVILVDENEKVEIECFVDSFPQSSIFWSFNRQIISINKTSIQINSVKSNQHIGRYICSTYHSTFGIFNRTIRLALKGPPEMIDEGKIHSVYVGQSIQFRCSISKHIPFQKIVWSQEDHILIKPNEKYEINQYENENSIHSELLIKDIKQSDENSYQCISQNEYGSSITTFHLTVFNSKFFFIRRFVVYGLIMIFIIILFILLYRYQSRQRDDKSSFTDPSISTLHKSDCFSSDFDHESHSNTNHCLSIKQFNDIHKQENSAFIENNPFDFNENSKRYSIVV